MTPQRREIKEVSPPAAHGFLPNPRKAATEPVWSQGGSDSWKLQGRTGKKGVPQENNSRSAEAPLSLWLNTEFHVYRTRLHKRSYKQNNDQNSQSWELLNQK